MASPSCQSSPPEKGAQPLSRRDPARFPMLEPQQGIHAGEALFSNMATRDAAHKLVTSHLRLVAKIAMGYRGYGLPIAK